MVSSVLPSFRLADDFLCDSDDVAVAQRQPRSLKPLTDQLGGNIPRLDIGNGWKGQQGSACGSVDFLAYDLNSGVGNFPDDEFSCELRVRLRCCRISAMGPACQPRIPPPRLAR